MCLCVFFQVLDGSTNLTIGATIPVLSRLETFSISFMYFYGSLLYAIPDGKPYSTLEKLYFPFDIQVWICICVLFFIAASVIIVLKILPNTFRDFSIGKSNATPFFNMINICLGGSITFHDMPLRNFARTILMIWMISTLILRNAYQGKLFDNLRGNQRMSPLYTFDRLYDSTIKLYIFASFLPFVKDAVPDHRLVIYLFIKYEFPFHSQCFNLLTQVKHL